MTTARFTYSTYINATPQELWDALTSPEFTAQYWGGRRMISDWKEGSDIRIIQPQGSDALEKIGKVLIANPPNLLSYSTDEAHPDRSSTMTFEIVQTPAQVRLNITHEMPGEIPVMVTEGWWAIASSLKTMLETGKPLDYSWWRG